MRKTVFGLLAVAVILGFATGPAAAQCAGSFLFESTLNDHQTALPADAYLRYYTPASDAINSGGDNICEGGALDPTDRACLAVYKAKKKAYRAYTDDTFNYGGTPEGTTYHGVWDMEENPGASNHRGYYAWACDVINCDETYSWRSVDCAGADTGSCLGTLDPASAVGTDVPNAPNGGVVAQLAMRPIPVPLVDSYDKNTGDISLSWNAASSVGCGDVARYDLLYVTDDANDGNCAAPTGGFTTLRTEAGTSTVVNVADVGLAPGDESCVTFAIQLRYPDYGGGAVLSRYTSGNGQSVYIGAGGLASEIYDIMVVPVAGRGVKVSWKTALEDGVRGFYVTRAFSQNGPYQRVSDLIPANGEPSSYNYLDTVRPGRGAQGNGVFYKIESIDIDDAVQVFGPVQLELPAIPGGVKPLRRPMMR